MQHLIATRLGVGISRPTFYEHHIKLLKHGLARCLENQTDKNFQWAVIVDDKIPKEHLSYLEEVIAPGNGYVVAFDPVKNLNMLPKSMESFEVNFDEDLIMSRIDDDDIISKDFVLNLRKHSEDFTKDHSSIALADGLNCYIDAGVYTPYFHPTTPVGISLFSLARKLRTVYSGNHNKMHQKSENYGGDVKVVRTDEPMWAYIRRSSSDSASYRAKNLPKDSKPFDEISEKFLVRSGLEADWFNKALDISNSEHDPRPEIVGTKLARLALKNEYLKMLKEVDKEDVNRFGSLVAAFYAI